jgi:hypothetical protein
MTPATGTRAAGTGSPKWTARPVRPWWTPSIGSDPRSARSLRNAAGPLTVDSRVIGLRIRYLGGPTALIEYGETRFLVDPTF